MDDPPSCTLLGFILQLCKVWSVSVHPLKRICTYKTDRWTVLFLYTPKTLFAMKGGIVITNYCIHSNNKWLRCSWMFQASLNNYLPVCLSGSLLSELWSLVSGKSWSNTLAMSASSSFMRASDWASTASATAIGSISPGETPPSLPDFFLLLCEDFSLDFEAYNETWQ